MAYQQTARCSRFKVTCPQTREGLPLQVTSYQNSSRQWVRTDPPCRRSNTGLLPGSDTAATSQRWTHTKTHSCKIILLVWYSELVPWVATLVRFLQGTSNMRNLGNRRLLFRKLRTYPSIAGWTFISDKFTYARTCYPLRQAITIREQYFINSKSWAMCFSITVRLYLWYYGHNICELFGGYMI